MHDTSVRTYLLLSAALFALVGVVHLMRFSAGWVFQVGPWVAPAWISLAAFVGTGALAVWALRLARR